MTEFRSGDARFYMKRYLDLARTIDPVAWSSGAYPEACRRRLLSASLAKQWIEMEDAHDGPSLPSDDELKELSSTVCTERSPRRRNPSTARPPDGCNNRYRR